MRRGSARPHIRRYQQVGRYAELVVLRNARSGYEAQPLLPGIRQQYSTAHAGRLLFDQVYQGLEDLLQRRAARDALEHAALAFEQGGAKAQARGTARPFSAGGAHFRRFNESLSAGSMRAWRQSRQR